MNSPEQNVRPADAPNAAPRPHADNDTSIGLVTAAADPATPPHALPMRANQTHPVEDTVRDVLWSGQPIPVPHTQTQSTLAPTAEFTRIFLLAWIIRYIFRGAAKVGFNELKADTGIANKIVNALSAPGRWFSDTVFKNKIPLSELENSAYSIALGLGSGALSLSYSKLVRNDIRNLFCETVAEEKGIPQEQVTFQDITTSENKIIKRTVENYHQKKWARLGTDALFFLAAPLRSEGVTDLLLGGKGVQIFADTWKRKTTLFEDLVTFVNNKINPRNGLGQPISMGEVFDLYQHYSEAFAPQKMFNNVLSRDATGRWAHSQPIFQRITELMNETYAYKHTTPADYNAAKHSGSDFALPKLIYMLGNDMIDPDQPARTLALVEVMNAHGGAAVKQAAAQLDSGVPPQAVLQQMGLHFVTPHATIHDPKVEAKNGVLPKGSTMQADAAPRAQIQAATATSHHTADLAAHAAQLT